MIMRMAVLTIKISILNAYFYGINYLKLLYALFLYTFLYTLNLITTRTKFLHTVMYTFFI